MKSLRLMLCAMPLMLTGCSTMSSVNWSAANPWNWFGSSTKVSEQGVGELTASTPLQEQALLFWLVLLLQARTWVLFVIAGASREQGTALLNLFYPDHDNFWLGLIPGIPAVLASLLSGRRATFPRTWRVLYFLLLFAQVVLLCWQPRLWLKGESVSGIGLALVVADIVALIWLLTNRRLRSCFNEEKE